MLINKDNLIINIKHWNTNSDYFCRWYSLNTNKFLFLFMRKIL